MTKIKTRISAILGITLSFALLVMLLVSCGKKDNSVTFVIDDKSQVVEIKDDGSITKPQDPTKEYYNFIGWYTDTDYKTEYDFAHPQGGSKAYAYFVAINVTIHVNDSEGAGEVIALKDLNEKTKFYEAEALKENLTFDGWYINSDYSTAYTSYENQNAGNLYGHYLAEVVFNNGYEDIYSVKLGVDKSLSDVFKTDLAEVDGFVKPYMDKTDLFYVYADEPIKKDSNGNFMTDTSGNYIYNDVDFSKPVGGNMKITVQWHTPALATSKWKDNPNISWNGVNSNNQLVKDYQAANPGATAVSYFQQFSVISFGSRIWATDENGDKYIQYISSLNQQYYPSGISGNWFASAKTIIIQEGIECVCGINGGSGSVTENIIMPETTKVILDSFNYFENLDSLNIPSNVEVIGNSFFANINPVQNPIAPNERIKGYEDIEIIIPKSVEYMYQVPAELEFEEGSTFFVEDDVVYQNTDNGLVYIFSTALDENDDLIIKNGVKGIQNNAFRIVTNTINNIYLPATWEFVNYAYGADKYSTLPYSSGTSTALMIDNPTDETILTTSVYARTVGDATNCNMYIFDTYEFPTNIKNYSFTNYNTKPESYLYKMAFIKTKESGNITVQATYTNTHLKEVGVNNHTNTITYQLDVDDTVSLDDFLAEADLSNIRITSVKELGLDYEFGGKTNRNLYLNIECEFDAKGFTYEKSADGTYAIVTGFDQTTASKIDGLYFVNILDEVVIDGVSLPVVEIKEEAFANESAISIVFIGSNIKVIGKKAFYNCENLEYISFRTRVLEEIKESAFEGTIIKTMKLPLASIKNIEPYAFKNHTLTEFVSVDDEVEYNQKVINCMFVGTMASMYNKTIDEMYEEYMPTVGSYYIMVNSNSKGFGIGKFTGAYEDYTYTLDEYNKLKAGQTAEKNDKYKGLDFDFVAYAGGFNSRQVNLGYSYRSSAMPANRDSAVFRFTIKEGSIYYLSYFKSSTNRQTGEVTTTENAVKCIFANIKKIEKNAFTDISAKAVAITENASTGVKTTNFMQYWFASRTTYSASMGGAAANVIDMWHSQEDLAAVASKDYDFNSANSIFEDGWFEGIMSTDSNYEEKLEFMKYLTKGSI